MNVRAGEYAWTTGAWTPGLNGRLVFVLRRAIPGERLELSDGTPIKLGDCRTADWIIVSSDPMPYLPTTGSHMTTIRPIRDAFLRPLRGLPVGEPTDVPVVETC